MKFLTMRRPKQLTTTCSALKAFVFFYLREVFEVHPFPLEVLLTLCWAIKIPRCFGSFPLYIFSEYASRGEVLVNERPPRQECVPFK